MHLSWIILFSAALLVSLNTPAQNLPDPLRQAIETRFPGAVINETESESFEGRSVTEVELTDAEGRDYEVLLSRDGEILNIEEDDGGLPWIGGELSLGLALRGEREIYRGAGTETELTPFLLYENGPLEILSYDDLSAVWQLKQISAFSVGIRGVILPEEGYDVDDSDYFEGMTELETLFQLGLQVDSRWRNWEFSLSAVQDLSSETDGQEIDLSATYTTVLGGLQLQPQLSLTWRSSEMVDYFYGVSTTEAREDRPAYRPGSALELEAQVLAIRPIGKGFSLVGLASAAWMSKEIGDSPLVEDDVELSATLGVMYSF